MALIYFLVPLAILLVLVAFVIKKLLPPPEIAHLPSLSLWNYIYYFMIHQQPMDQRSEMFPEMSKAPLVRFFVAGRWEVIVKDVDYARQIYTSPDIFPKFLISDIEPAALTSRFFGINLVFSNGKDWKNQHRVISPAFQTKNLIKISSNVFRKVVARVFVELAKIDSKPVDIHDWTQRFALDALGQGAFSFDLGAVSDRDAPYVKTYNNVVKKLLKPLIIVFPSIAHLPIPSIRKLRAEIEEFDTLLYSIIDARKKKKEQLGSAHNAETAVDLLDLMLCSSEQSDGESYAFSDKELRDNCVIFFLAGHDTTANSLAIVSYYLARYPEWQEIARKEVLEQYKQSGTDQSVFEYVPTYDDQKQYEIINAIIKEALRLYPSVAILPARRTTQAVQFGDLTVPKDTIVTVNIFEMMRSEKVWGPDATEFHPERFLPEDHPLAKDKKVTRNDNAYAFNAFGAGSRSCIGQQFSMIEQRMFIGTTLLRYDLSLPSGFEKLQLNPSGLLSPKDLFVNMKRRF